MTVRRALPLTLLASLLLAGCSEGRGALVVSDPDAGAADYEYLIPAGTAERIAAGETVEILPAELSVHVGEVIRIVNEDSAGHFVGIFYVGPGETVTQRFASPGDFSGLCTIHPSGQITLTVSE
jgi:plastocyanin